MGFWPFSGSKKSRPVPPEEQAKQILFEKGNLDTMARLEKTRQKGTPSASRSESRRSQDEKSRRVSRSRMQSPNVPVNTSSRTQNAPVPSRYEGLAEKRRGSQSDRNPIDDSMYQQNPMSRTSVGPDSFSVIPQPPTLKAKRSDYDSGMPRRKSSKRKAEDYAREREIRAMSSSPMPGPKRPATYSGSGPLRRDTKQIPGDLNRRLHRPTSEISLPIPESISDAGDLSHQNAFKIGILAALSPRPTVRYDKNPRVASGKQPVRAKPNVHDVITEEDVSPKRRIDDLADDLDAGGLRELMEKDRRRRERKKESDKTKLQRKLQRKADRDKEEETRRARVEAFASEAAAQQERSTQDSEQASRPQQQDVEDTIPKSTGPSAPASKDDPFADPTPVRSGPPRPIRNPFEDEKDVDLMQDPFDHEDDDRDEPPLPVRSPLRTAAAVEVPKELKPSQASMSPPTSPLQKAMDRKASQGSHLAREPTPDVPVEIDRRASDQSSTQQLNSWTSFFKRGGRRKPSVTDRGRTTPSEFSNTSRESFARKQPPPIVTPRTFKRSDSATPQRTMSKFREDLPELPMSPPDSRVQSPEVAPAHHAATVSQSSSRQPRPSHSGTLDATSLATSSSNPALDHGRPESRIQARQSMDLDAVSAGTAPVALSQSLASVDSEGSWLSGKPVKRLSGPTSHSLKQGETSVPRVPGGFDTEGDEVVDDEYFHRLTPAPEERRESAVTAGRRASSTIIDLQKEREKSPVPEVPRVPNAEDETWHSSIGRQATIVRQASRAKSKEGLLKDYEAEEHDSSDGDEDDNLQEIETPADELQEAPIMRARSVEYKGHARHISAGSAKLLDIRRSSVQSESIPRTPTMPRTPTGVPERTDPTEAAQ